MPDAPFLSNNLKETKFINLFPSIARRIKDIPCRILGTMLCLPQPCPASHGLRKLKQHMKEIEGENAAAGIAAVSDKRLTGAAQIDEALADVVGCIMRDFMQSWYSRISEDHTFTQQVKSTLEKVLVSLAQR